VPLILAEAGGLQGVFTYAISQAGRCLRGHQQIHSVAATAMAGVIILIGSSPAMTRRDQGSRRRNGPAFQSLSAVAALSSSAGHGFSSRPAAPKITSTNEDEKNQREHQGGVKVLCAKDRR